MQPIINDQQDFYRHYWNYYLSLERDFLKTESYITIDPDNFCAFSIEYVKLIQAICSEIDVVAKCYCNIIDNSSRSSKINEYCRIIVDNNPEFADEEIIATNYNITLKPWEGWVYTISTNGCVESTNPEWWTKYNKIKHARTTYNSSTGMQYYKFANLKNVINSLGGLFVINMSIHKKIVKNITPDTDKIFPTYESTLFEMANWHRPKFTWGDLKKLR